MLNKSHGNRTSKQGLAIVLVLLACLIAFTLRDYIVSFLGAVIFYVLFRPLMGFLCEKHSWKRGLAAALILLLSFLVILLPTLLVSFAVVPKLSLFFSDTSMIIQTIKDADFKLQSITGIQLLSEQNLLALQEKATGFITGFFSQSLNALISVGIMYLFLFFLLVNFGRMELSVEKYLPFSKENITRFSHELKAQTFSNTLGAPLYGILQGIIAAIGYWIFGVNEPIFWGMVTGLFSFVPVVGSTAIWLPAAVIMMSNGYMGKGIALIAYGLVVISMVDNVCRMAFQKRFADVHPLVTILGFILGISLFGIPGIIFGPLLISYFLILLKIYREEFVEINK